MTGPNHLWSGDWERESAEAAAELAERPAPPIEPPTVEETEPEGRQRRRFGAKQLLLGIVGLLVVAAVAVAIVISSSGSSNPPVHANTSTNTHTGTQAQPFPGSSGGVTPSQSIPTTPTVLPPATSVPTAEWLGMQIVTSPGGAVVDTVRAGSPGDAAGFEPGDVISGIGEDPINSVADIRAATEKLPLGQQLKITISRGSSTLTTAVALKVRPTIKP
jgi:membrane-associated protease RseP (regulator of RpoE activity)